MIKPAVRHSREERATWISPWVPIVFALMAIVMLLPDIFAGYSMFQRVEKIQSKQPLQLYCRQGDRGQVLYVKQDQHERQLNESQLCQILAQYPDSQIYEITLLNYPLDYAPHVINLIFSESALYADLPATTFQHHVNLDEFRHEARTRFLTTLLWIVVVCLLVMFTMYMQKRKYQKR